MKTIAWNLLLFGLPALLALEAVSQVQYTRGYAAGQASVPKAIATLDVDHTCTQWLFQSNARDTKRKICGGKK